MVRYLCTRAVILLILSTFTSLLDAATISGRIHDSTAGVLPGVTVEATPVSGGAATIAMTSSDGSYALSVPPGRYDLAFRLIGFATAARRALRVDEVAPAILDVTLLLQSSADIVVTARNTFRDLRDVVDPSNGLIGFADAATVGVITTRDIEQRPFQRPAQILEAVPGLIVSQHSGEGKANQYYLRGFNLDHGTDIAITVAGVPVNMPTHGHGQGYADSNFLIPELVSAIQFKKGPYYAEEGDFASAGAVNINYLSLLEKPILFVQAGMFGYERALIAGSPQVGGGVLLYALEANRNQGPWERGDDLRKFNGLLRYTRGSQIGGFSVTASGYDGRWNSSDQIPDRAVESGAISRFGLVDATNGGATSRYSLASEWQHGSSRSITRASAYVARYQLRLFSNFTYFLDDPVNGDQFEQGDQRWLMGGSGSHRWLSEFAGVPAENVAGIEVRRDDIDRVGLYKTRDRARLTTTREDAVLQTSTGLYGQSALQWTPWLRTLIGVRADRYDFDVRSGDELNGGLATGALVSPKLSMIFGPFSNSELYLNWGSGFHSNDARGTTIRIDPGSGEPVERVTPLVRSRGAEAGLRTRPLSRLSATAAVWTLDLASELVFVGDTGTTEASRGTRRSGIELSAQYQLSPRVSIDSEYAYSRARFEGAGPEGDRVPGAIEGVASAGLNLGGSGPLSAELRYRYFGPRPLVEDNSVRSEASSLVSGRLGYQLHKAVRLTVDVFNLLDSDVSDIDYFYRSRLPGEAAGGTEDTHFHPVEKRSVRLGITTTF